VRGSGTLSCSRNLVAPAAMAASRAHLVTHRHSRINHARETQSNQPVGD
jgi:hypothetical protein